MRSRRVDRGLAETATGGYQKEWRCRIIKITELSRDSQSDGKMRNPMPIEMVMGSLETSCCRS